MERLFSLRERLYKMISDYFASGEGHCKSYEGHFVISADYGDYFDDNNAEDKNPKSVVIHVDVYVVGPHRHYDFAGKTFAEALDKLEAALDEWERGEE